MSKNKRKTKNRLRRRIRIRAKLHGTSEKPRLSVFKSNKYIWAQIVDDEKGLTIAGASTKGLKGSSSVEKAKEMGRILAKKAIDNKIKKVVFDRGGYVYTGKIKAVAEGARESGLIF